MALMRFSPIPFAEATQCIPEGAHCIPEFSTMALLIFICENSKKMKKKIKCLLTFSLVETAICDTAKPVKNNRHGLYKIGYKWLDQKV
jgi:hypothetical protein